MKWKILRQVIYMSKLAFYGISLQFFLCSMLVAAPGNSQHKSLEDVYVSVEFNNTRLKEAFFTISEQTTFNFAYNDAKIDLDKVINTKATNQTLADLLREFSKDYDLKFKRINGNIFVSKKKGKKPVVEEVMELGSIMQVKVSGTVTSDDSEPLPGVSIIVKGTASGTTTDIDGNFTLNVPSDATLQFSYIGYVTQEVVVGNQSKLEVKLEADLAQLEEVVVIGYGTVKKSDLTGAVSSVNSKDFGDRSTTSVAGLLQGRAAGVDVTGGQIRVRGVTTLNNTDPLYVIDGFIGGDAGTVHPSDIESIEVLKDASATAIYGARGANGVILITTKKGKSGAPKIQFNAFYGVTDPAKQLDMLNSTQYMDLLKDIELNGGTTLDDLTSYDKLFNPDGSYTDYATTDRTDWQKEMFHTGSTQEYTMSIRGGSDKSNYSVSTAYNANESIGGTGRNENFKFGVVGDWKVFNNKVKISENFRIQHWNNTGAGPNLLGGLRMPSYSPVLDPTALGGYAYVTTTDDLNDATNPQTDLNLIDNNSKGISLMGQLRADIEIIDGLNLNTSIGITGYSSTDFEYSKPRQNGNLVFPKAELTESMRYGYTPLIENYLTYNKEFGVHNITAMVGNTYQKSSYGRSLEGYGKGFINNEVLSITKAENNSVTQNSGNVGARLSYFGRLNYSLLDRYLITANFRTDGSDRFAPANRWGYFPSIAAAWKIHEESFMQGVSAISFLKLRASYGTTGNDAIGQFRYFSQVHKDVAYAFPSHGFGGITFNGATINTLSSPVIKWEEVKNTSVGLDIGFLDDKIMLNADYFHKNTYDILFGVPQPPSLGMGNNGGGGDAIVNAASVENKGIELALSYKNVSGEFTYNISGNVTFVTNSVTDLGNGKPYNAGSFGFYSSNRTEEGEPIGYFYGFKKDKVYMNQSEVDQDNALARQIAKQNNPDLTDDELAEIFYQSSATSAGDFKFIDVDGDGKVTDDDRTNLGTAIPKISYGIAGSANYKGFDFFMNWTGKAGHSNLYEFGYWMEGMIRPFNATSTVLDRWQSESQPGNGEIPRAVKTDPSKNLRMSDHFVHSASYFRLNLVSLGYSLPQSLIESAFKGNVEGIRFYISADNLVTITKYPGYNPEVSRPNSWENNNLDRGIDRGTWPATRAFRAGLQLNF